VPSSVPLSLQIAPKYLENPQKIYYDQSCMAGNILIIKVFGE